MRCFVIRGFGEKKDFDRQVIDFDRIHRELIAPALRTCEVDGDTTVEVVGAGQIHQDMFQLILQADLVICDITVHNPNVFYELGVRHALRRKHTVLIKGRPSADATPFDISGVRYLSYPIDAPAGALQDLVEAISATLATDRETDSPVFLMLPQLRPADISGITTVPLSFVEEVKQAAARRDKGWLRLLAEDVRGEIFEREGLRLIGREQWHSVSDFREAARAWESVREVDEGELEANFALANVYERIFKQSDDPAVLELSNLAIQRVLASDEASTKQRSEALALEGRNFKSLWRRDFAEADMLEECRERAIDPRAKRSYEAYRDAHLADLNHFNSGIAALQMGSILLSLAKEESFSSLFSDLRTAARYRDDLAEELESLRHVAQASIERARLFERGNEQVWAEISAVDLRFLALGDSPSTGAVYGLAKVYNAAVPMNSFFTNAVCNQLELFERLGMNASAARTIVKELGGAQSTSPGKRHVVVFTGHTVDRAPTGAATRPPRFPTDAKDAARALIEAALRKLQDEGGQLTVLASGAPGADILALEACDELGIPTWLCLPLESNTVGREVFQHFDDDWRNRFIALVKRHAPPTSRTFVLSESEKLPQWLRLKAARGMTPWSRGNRWMLHQARAWGATDVTLLAFWNRDESDLSGEGTAAMVRLARGAPLRIEHIDCRPLVGG